MTPDFDGPRLIRPTELRASERLSRLVFQDEVTREREDETAQNAAVEPAPPVYRGPARSELHVICSRGTPVAQIYIFHTRLRVYDGYINVGSIGGVATHPDYRGLGLATRLMQHCAQRLVEGGASLMLISGGRGLYTRLGNVPGPRFERFRLKPGQLNGLAPVRLRPALPADSAASADVGVCSRLYASEPVHFVRPPEKFRQQLGLGDGFYRAEQWIIELDGQPEAYLLLNRPWESIGRPDGAGVRCIFEYAGSRVALAGAIAAALELGSISALEAPIAWQDADLLHLLRTAGGVSEPAGLPDHTLRILDFPALMAGLRPLIRARLEPSLRRGLRFEQSGPLLGGEGSDQFCIVRSHDRLVLDGAQMARMVIGLGSEKGNPSASGALGEIIPALFPLPAFMAGLDYH